jgi:hypothetical protein
MQARKSYRKKTVFDELTPKATEILKIHVRTSLRQRIQAQFTEVEDSTGEVYNVVSVIPAGLKCEIRQAYSYWTLEDYTTCIPFCEFVRTKNVCP